MPSFHLTAEQKNELTARIQKRYPDFRDFQEPGSLGRYELDYKHAALAKWNERMGLAAAEALLNRGKGMEVVEALKSTVSLNIVNFRSWTYCFGEDERAATDVMVACARAAREGTGSFESLERIFAAAAGYGRKLNWDALSVTLWAFNPVVFFPIKISFFRRMAESLGWELPPGRPDAAKYRMLMEFVDAFREFSAPWSPRDGTDVQSILWGCIPGEVVPDSGFGDPFGGFFEDAEDADRKLDAMRRVILVLQKGDEERDVRLVSTFRPSGPHLRVIFGNWVIFSLRPDGACQFLLPADDPLLTPETRPSSFVEPIDGVSYSLGWFPTSALEDGDIWRKAEAAMDAAHSRFSHWSTSNYAANHSPELYQMIMDPSSRAEILGRGLTSPEKPGAVWLLAPGEGGDLWEKFQADGTAEIGWNDTGDLSELRTPEDFREAVRNGHPDSGAAKVGKMLNDFARSISVGDRIFAKLGKWKTLGYGIVESGYEYHPGSQPFVHKRKVRWISAEVCTMPEDVNLPVQTLSRIDVRPEVMEALNDFYGLEPGSPPPPVVVDGIYTKDDALADLFMEEARLDAISTLLKRKKNIILQGAPGTGKTFVARRLAYLLMGVKDPSRAPMVQFHQSTSYEDFVQGFRPDGKGGFVLRDGIFHTFCKEAVEQKDKSFVLIIDEINRGNLPKIFGELMMLIEHDKRDASYAVPLTYASDREETFYVPENVYLIGTMNSADRSLSMVDYALRRRFAFIEAEPGFSSPAFAEHLRSRGAPSSLVTAIRQRMETLNGMISADMVNLGRGYRIGHSFFVPGTDIVPDTGWYQDIIHHEVLPLIGEYWMDDAKRLDDATELLLAPV